MFLKLLAFLGALVFVATTADSQMGSDDILSWPLVSVCQVFTDPQAFDGKMIRLRGVAAGTDEGGFLISPQHCPTVYVTGDHKWPLWVALTAPDSGQRLHKPVFVYDSHSEEILLNKYRMLQKRYPDRCLLSTDAGLFETRSDWSKSRAVYTNGSSRYLGFGNQNIAPAQLLLKGYVDVEVDPECGPRAP